MSEQDSDGDDWQLLPTPLVKVRVPQFLGNTVGITSELDFLPQSHLMQKPSPTQAALANAFLGICGPALHPMSACMYRS
jgi:hypothetical protein